MPSVFKVLLIIVLMTQVNDPLVYAQNQKLTERSKTIELQSDKVKVIPVGKNGVVVVDFKSQNTKGAISIQRYDSLFELKWENSVSFTKGYYFYQTMFSDNNLYLSFSNSKADNYEFVKLDLTAGYFNKFSFSFSNSFLIKEIITDDNTIWASGQMLNRGIVFALNMNNKKVRVLPVGSSNAVYGVNELKYDSIKNELEFFLYTTEGAKTYIYRKVSPGGKVLQNELLMPPSAVQLGGIKSIRTHEGLFVAGVFYKKSGDKPKGLFFYKISDQGVDQKHFMSFKNIPAFTKYSKFEQYLKKDQESTIPTYQSKETGIVAIDAMGIGESGPMVTIELTKKNYRTRGYLERERDKEIIENVVDKNTFGRRDMAALSEGQTLDDRIDNYSGTEIQQYMYRDALVNQPVFEGYGYGRTSLFTLNNDLTLKHHKSILVDPDDQQFYTVDNATITNDKIHFIYGSRGEYRTFNLNATNNDIGAFRIKKFDQKNGFLLNWYSGKYLYAVLLKNDSGSKLYLQNISL